MTDAIKPCPFCGETQNIELGSSTQDREGYPVYLFCSTCGSQGPWMYAPDYKDAGYTIAAQRWNARKNEE